MIRRGGKKMTLFEARFENKESGGIHLEIPILVDPSICTDDEELWIQAFNHAWRKLIEEGFDPDKYRLRELRLIAL